MDSKFDLRLESARFAVMVDNIRKEDVIPMAKEIEKYILGDNELPEMTDKNLMLEMAARLFKERPDINETEKEKAE